MGTYSNIGTVLIAKNLGIKYLSYKFLL